MEIVTLWGHCEKHFGKTEVDLCPLCAHAERVKERDELKEAVRGLNSLIIEAQETMTAYLAPDGIDADAAIERVIELLDGPQQREAQRAALTALGERA